MNTPYETMTNIHSHASVPWQQDILIDFLEKIKVSKGTLCADVGTGIGNNLSTLLKYINRVTALDVSENALGVLQRRYAQEQDRIEIKKMDSHHLNYCSESFDLIICTEVLEHCFEPQKALSECVRVLKPGGYIVISVPNYLNLAGLMKKIQENLYPEKTWDVWNNHDNGIENFTTSLKIKKWAEKLRLNIIDDRGGDLIRSWMPFFRNYYKIIDRHPNLTIGKYWPLKIFMMNYFVLARKRTN